MERVTPPEGVDLCIRWEGWHKALPDGRAKPYLCPARVPTIGYGSTYWEDGTKVRLTDDAITKEVGRQLLLRQLQNYANAVYRAIKVAMSPQMWAACISLAYNIGTGAFAKSTLVRRINARDWAGCPEAFKRYKKPAPAAAPAPTQKAPAVDEGPWWAQVVRGILDGLGGRAAVPA
jgi:lysozyme